MATEAAGGLQAIGILAKTATVNNAGLISASGPDAINDGINTTGLTTITNAATGTISSSSRSGVRVNNATIMNAGLITGNEGIVFRNAGATGSVFNSGTITGTSGIAIDFGLNGSALPFTLDPGSGQRDQRQGHEHRGDDGSGHFAAGRERAAEPSTARSGPASNMTASRSSTRSAPRPGR